MALNPLLQRRTPFADAPDEGAAVLSERDRLIANSAAANPGTVPTAAGTPVRDLPGPQYDRKVAWATSSARTRARLSKRRPRAPPRSRPPHLPLPRHPRHAPPRQ